MAPVYKVVNLPFLRFLKNIWPVTIIIVKISQFQPAAWKYLLKAELKVPSVTCRGFIVFIFMTCAVDLCGASHTCLESALQLWFCSQAKGHTGGFLHIAWFSLGAYLLITAITTATLVCLFAGMVHQCVCIPLTGADVSGGCLGRDTAVRGYADCRCGIQIEEPPPPSS